MHPNFSNSDRNSLRHFVIYLFTVVRLLDAAAAFPKLNHIICLVGRWYVVRATVRTSQWSMFNCSFIRGNYVDKNWALTEHSAGNSFIEMFSFSFYFCATGLGLVFRFYLTHVAVGSIYPKVNIRRAHAGGQRAKVSCTRGNNTRATYQIEDRFQTPRAVTNYVHGSTCCCWPIHQCDDIDAF